MGGPTNYLVPVAILYDNPGLSLDQFKEKLLDVTSKVDYNVNKLRTFNDTRDDYGIPYILNLPEREENIQKNYKESTSQEFNHVKYTFYFDYKRFSPDVNHYSFEVKEDDLIVNCNAYENWRYKKGDYLDFWHMPEIDSGLEYQVTEVLSTNTILIPYDKESYVEEVISQRVKCRSVKIEKKVEEFFTLKDALKKYPEHSPENLWDFTLEKGILYPDRHPHNKNVFNKGRINTFYWYKKNNKL